jgi:hypothetical protein
LTKTKPKDRGILKSLGRLILARVLPSKPFVVLGGFGVGGDGAVVAADLNLGSERER